MIGPNIDSFEEQDKNYDISLFNPKNDKEKINETVSAYFPFMKSNLEDDESFFCKNPQQELDLNIKPKIQAEYLFGENNDKKTKPNTTTFNKEKTEDIGIKLEIPEDTHIFIFNFDDNSDEEKEKEKEEQSMSFLGKKKLRGRRKKNAKRTNDEGHGKNSDDNKMRKIKTHLMDIIVNIINDSLKDKTYPIYKIDKEINECLKREYNMELMERTISDIFSNTPVSSKYKKNNDKFYNYNIIQKILNEKIELNTIDILNKKYLEMLKYIRENNLDDFLNSIKKKEKKSQNKNLEEYINSIKKLFFRYEDWFKDKKGRKREKKQKNEDDI